MNVYLRVMKYNKKLHISFRDIKEKDSKYAELNLSHDITINSS